MDITFNRFQYINPTNISATIFITHASHYVEDERISGLCRVRGLRCVEYLCLHGDGSDTINVGGPSVTPKIKMNIVK